MPSYALELAVAIAAVQRAGATILQMFETAKVSKKADGSPVTEADLASDRIIRSVIGAAFPTDTILTEEGVDDPQRLKSRRCWIVDPIDGTAAFVRRSKDFDVYIALVEDGHPVVAATLQPITGLLLSAATRSGAQINRRSGSARPLLFRAAGDSPRLGSRGWLGAPANLPLLGRVAGAIGPNATVVRTTNGLGSRSFIPPDNEVDAIVGVAVDGRKLDAWEWDLAAVDLIVREAGGRSTDLSGNPLRFNQPDPRIQDLLLSTDPYTHSRILAAIASTMHDQDKS
jgi:3'-phosphoadenosine 5'-phosphosulfate (PAPS) 3'-phosphatase